MSNIRQELFRGVFWSAVEKYSGVVLSIGISMVLARLLGPKEYGVVAIATVLISFLNLFCNMGLGPAIIQQKDLTQDDCNSLFTFSLLVGTFLSVLFFCSSWGVAWFYGNQQLVSICQILSIQLLASAANMVPNALMNKNKRFKEKAKRTLFFQVVCGFFAIVSALAGAGVYALIITPLVTSIGVFCWNWSFYKVYIDKTFNLEPIKRVFSFSSFQFLFDICNYFSCNLDKIIIGKYFSVSSLGIYEKSYNLMQMPISNVSFVLNPVLQPVMKELQDDRKTLNEKFLKIVKLTSTISFPLGIILWGMAYECIHFFYGGNWDDAIPIFKILVLSVPCQMLLSVYGFLYLVCNDTKTMFYVGIRNTITTITGIIIAIVTIGTVDAVAISWTITVTVNFILSFKTLYARVLCLSAIPFFKMLVKPVFIASVLILTEVLLNRYINSDYLIIQLLLKGSLSLITALLLVQITKLYDLLALFKRK